MEDNERLSRAEEDYTVDESEFSDYSEESPEESETLSSVTAALSVGRIDAIGKHTKESRKHIQEQYLYAATHEGPSPEELANAEEPEMEKSKAFGIFSSNLMDILLAAETAILIVVVLFTFGFSFTTIKGDSMVPTVNDGDVLILRTVYRNPQYGDIVIIDSQNELDESLCKRVIAVGGQKVDIDYTRGYVFVDDVAIEESYIKEFMSQGPVDAIDFPVYVPYGTVFVMGDNRNISLDSRSQTIGFVKEENIVGKVLFRLKPAGQFSVY